VRARYVVIPAVLVVAALALAGGVYAYDSGQKTKLAEGVTVGGVDVGGMEVAAARSKLRSEVYDPLNRPVRVRYQDEHFTLTPAKAKIAVDIDGSIDRAVAASRDGNAVTRTWREVTGKEVAEDVDVRVDYSKQAVRSLVKRVSGTIDEDAVDASVDLDKGQVDPQKSKNGLEVRTARLRRELEREILDDGDQRMVRVRTRVVKPKVTTADLEKKYPSVILINRGAFKLTLYKKLKPAKTYGIAVGQVGLETPAGLYHIQNKAINPAWHVPNSGWAGSLAGQVIPGGAPNNPLKARWMGIYDGAGIHGTSEEGSIGSAASHGCIRMRVPEVEALYDEVDVGAPVYIS
jgi:lipoprotein-anchoring transpeptidase ErfK/SrfK